MIIKGLFRRYERWNPVHPTLGTFWGMGIGVGCGVGWGPGFGPEVIGYVGAGCGIGFSVGFTLAGVGIGLPQNVLLQIPHNASATSNAPLESARTYAFTIMKNVAGDTFNFLMPYISFARKATIRKFSNFKENVQIAERVNFRNLNKTVSGRIQSTVECLGAFKDQHWPPRKGA
ncbi:cadmium-induced protein AS8 isoform X2 [Typha latifolia]|uniref:cadmium-induced protein AS8 isoform X2 n=2 Tax=Typha latifolia TaxID=4733 RepID=UPI003C309450